MENYKICDECNGKMLPTVIDQEFNFNGRSIVLKGLNAFKCEECGNIVYSFEEATMIDRLIRAFDSKPAIDALNLEETAEYLRVSNQTIYNMIKAGRIRAYKVGREWRILRSDIQAYLDGSCNDTELRIAAKGGQITDHDKNIILEEIEKRNKQ